MITADLLLLSVSLSDSNNSAKGLHKKGTTQRSLIIDQMQPTTTLFLKEASDAGFVRVESRGSVTLHDLTELYNISSVLECDSSGNVHARTMVIDAPSSVLHRGNHYIVRRDATLGGKENRVTFQPRVLVKEFAVGPPTQTDDDGSASLVVMEKPTASSTSCDPSESLFDGCAMSVVYDTQDDASTRFVSSSGPSSSVRQMPSDAGQRSFGSDFSNSSASSATFTAVPSTTTHVFFPFVASNADGTTVKVTWDVVQSMLDRNYDAEWSAQHRVTMSAVEEAERLLQK